jgi:hypothetical protein
VFVEKPEELEYLLGKRWWKIVVKPKMEGRDILKYTISCPVYLLIRPTRDNNKMYFAMKGLEKKNQAGMVQWDTKVGRADATETKEGNGVLHALITS